MYDLPEQPPGSSIEIDESVVEGKRRSFEIPEPATKSA
jgi:hypothetical protein